METVQQFLAISRSNIYRHGLQITSTVDPSRLEDSGNFLTHTDTHANHQGLRNHSQLSSELPNDLLLRMIKDRTAAYRRSNQSEERHHSHDMNDNDNALESDHLEALASVNKLEEMLRQALAGGEKLPGREHPGMLMIIDNLSCVLERQGRNGKAGKIHQQVLAVSEKVLESERFDTLSLGSYFSSALQRQDKYKEAEEMLRRTLEASEKVLGREHPDTLSRVSSLGSVLRDQGKYTEAEEMHRRSLEVSEKVLGRDHPPKVSSVSNLGSATQDEGKYNRLRDL